MSIGRSTFLGLIVTCLAEFATGQTIESLVVIPDGNLLLSSPRLYRSTNNGDLWLPVVPGLGDYRWVSKLVRHSNGTIYAGTDAGVYSSTDKGVSWQLINSSPTWVHAFLFTPLHIYVGADNGAFRMGYDGGELTTINGGLSSTYVRSFSLTRDNHIIASTWGGTGLYRSNDTIPVSSWQPIYNGPTGSFVMGLSVTSLGTAIAATSAGLHRSTDHGQSWARVTSGLTTNDFRAALYSRRQRRAFVGTGNAGIFQSSDDGNSWTNPLTGNDIQGFCVNSAGGLFALSSDRKLFRSTNGGDSWTLIVTLTTPNIGYSLACGPTDILYAAGNGGMARSSDNGVTWNPVLSDAEITSIAINRQGIAIAASTSNGAFRSTDGGNNWTNVTNGITPYLYSAGFDSSGKVYVGSWSSGFYVSTNNGDSWSSINPPTLATAFAADTGNYLYAGTDNDGVFTSNDQGLNWNNTSRTSYVRSTTTTTDGYCLASGFPGAYWSSDNGITWFASAGSAAQDNFNCFLPLPGGQVLAGGSRGLIFRSSDSGEQWNTPMAWVTAYINELAADSDGNLFAATEKGLCRSTDSGATWKAINTGLTSIEQSETLPGSFSLSQNYPNPFNPGTTIRYSLPARSQVTISILNALGQQVSVLVHGEIEAGFHQVRFDGSGLSSGVYFCRLQAGTFVETRKLLLLR